MGKKQSIHSIAQMMNVSAATVSYVLNGKTTEKRISKEVSDRILGYAESIGFEPNVIARTLRTGRSNVIAMLVEDISDPFFSSIARVVEVNLSYKGYKVFFASTENDTEKTKQLIRLFRDRQVDGYIIAPPPGIETELAEIQEDGIALTLFDRYFPGLDTCNVVVDNFGGASQAVEHLVENGYRKIAFVTLDSDQTQMNERLMAYQTCMRRSGLREDFVLKLNYNCTDKEIADSITRLLSSGDKPDAIFFATNYLAVNGLSAINGLSMKIPDDIAVVSFDDNIHFALFTSSVTAVSQPVKEISEHVAERLLAGLLCKTPGEKMRSGTIQLATKLIIRKSSLRPTSKAFPINTPE